MTIQEKIKARELERKDNNLIDRAIRRAFITIMCGYFGGTIIGFILRRLING